MDEEGLLARHTADYVLGEPSLYGRRNSPGIATRAEGSSVGGIAYDSVHHRLFARDFSVNAWAPNGRILVFDAHPDRITNGSEALAVFGQPDFTTRSLGGLGRQKLASMNGTVLDEKHQRLFVTDGDNNRIMVWDVHPERMGEVPEAIVVLGQADFFSNDPGLGPDGFDDPGSILYDVATDRLFVADTGNHRILVFEAAPEQLQVGMDASEVLGQPDFSSNEAGIGRDRFSRPTRLSYDERYERLLVTDSGNQQLLFFAGDPNALRTGAEATHVLGQPDFTSRGQRTDLKKWARGGTMLDQVNQRLFAGEGNRLLVFDVHPNRLANNADAVAVMFQENWEDVETTVVSATQEISARPFLNEQAQKLYVASSYYGRNGVSFWDVSPEALPPSGASAVDILGHFDWEGNIEWENRGAFGRAGERYLYARGVALDEVDNRLFLNDQYLNRVLVFDLDDERRIVDRRPKVILGQPHAYTGLNRPPSARTMHNPLALAYDPGTKSLFVADARNHRILVFDAHPDRLSTFDEAIAVLGRPDFTSKGTGRETGPDVFDFANAGVTSTFPNPIGFAVDRERGRLFVSDGGNHRVLVFDIRPGRIHNGVAAIGVIGQPDFVANRPTPDLSGAGGGFGLFNRVAKGRATDNRGFDTPSGLAYDPNQDRLFVVDGNNARVLVFEAAPEAIRSGQEPIAVLGQMDYTSGDEVRLDLETVTEDVARRRMRMPSGIAYDTVNDRVYVNDKGNDRILIFEAAPDELESGMAAVGVIGQRDFVTRIAGNGEQEELLDPRQIVFDSEQQRLFVTDSYWARLMVYDLPRTERPVELQARGLKTYGTIDAWNGRNMPEKDARSAWRGTLTSEDPLPGAVLVYYNTRQEMDRLAKRRGRLLISESSVAAPEAELLTLAYVDQSGGKRNVLVLSNPGTRATSVDLRFRGEEVSTPGARWRRAVVWKWSCLSSLAAPWQVLWGLWK